AGAVSAFADELRRYTAAKKKGQGRTPVCSLCSSPYRVDKQEEAGVLFAPQVYSNKRPLHSTDARRDICSVCGLELMLRQVLMNDSGFSGGRFEGRRLRYLYFYPTYFFTPETLAVLRRAYAGLRNLPYTELRRQLVGRDGSVNLAPGTLQRLEPLLLAPEGETPTQDRFLRLHMPEEQACSFSFVGLPPGRDAKDAEAWVYPALLALLLPLCLDVKVVASESSVPLLLEADDIPETVFLDAPHAAVQYLTRGRTRVHTDDLLPTLQRLMAGYLIHIDANSSMGRQGYDYRWQDLPALARALATSPLYAFHYLKKGQRQRAGEAAPAAKAREYLAYVQFLDGGEAMSHAQELTRLYRQFYRARRYNSNSVLRPISIAARAVLDADPRLFDREGLIEAVVGELRSFAERAQREGLAYLPRGSTHAQRDEAMRAFARYFVETLFYGVFRGDRSALRGRQLNLLKGACEVIYQDESARDRAEREALALDGATDD
ncbi:MAG: type I-D CRISPR-associated protein Cas10d/Csc3, partial [Anaerolineae bacterium]